MREALEEMRDDIVGKIADFDRSAALIAHDGITEMIDKAEELAAGAQAAPIMVAPVNQVRDMLNEVMSNALTPLPKPKKHGDRKRNAGAKTKTKASKTARKLKRGTR